MVSRTKAIQGMITVRICPEENPFRRLIVEIEYSSGGSAAAESGKRLRMSAMG